MLDKIAFRSIPSGLYIISSKTSEGRRVGCVVNTLIQVASEPPTLSISLNKDNATTQAIMETGTFSATVLTESATMELIGLFGFHSSRDLDKFQDIECIPCMNDLVYTPANACARFVVKVEHRVDVGSHIMFVGPVADAEALSSDSAMTYAYYHKVLRGKTPPKAASFIAEEGIDSPTEQTGATAAGDVRYGWRCSLCGYIVEQEELPDDFKCPICGVGKEFFERIEL